FVFSCTATRLIVPDPHTIFEIRMFLRSIGHRHRMLTLCMGKEVIDTFLFHKAAYEVEIRLPILHTIISRLKYAIDLEFCFDTVEYFLENVRDGFILKDPAV